MEVVKVMIIVMVFNSDLVWLKEVEWDGIVVCCFKILKIIICSID